MKCDNCKTNAYPILTAFEAFGKIWMVCPKCGDALEWALHHRMAYFPRPQKKGRPRTQVDQAQAQG